jgi:peroxiredoxin Q/BCP
MALQPGDQAPDFTIPDQNGDLVSLSALQGRPVGLYFYPKADTDGNKNSIYSFGSVVKVQ